MGLGKLGASDEALLAVVTGKVRPKGRLPFELPRSMERCGAGRGDADGSSEPLFRVGLGIRDVNAAKPGGRLHIHDYQRRVRVPDISMRIVLADE